MFRATDVYDYKKPLLHVGKPPISMKDFFKEHSHLRLDLQHLCIHGGCWCIQIFNTTYDSGMEPIYKHYILDMEIEACVLEFEEIIMICILNWWDDMKNQRERR